MLLNFSELEEKRKLHLLGGGKEKQEEYKNKGNLTAFERMNTLMDPETFVELDPFDFQGSFFLVVLTMMLIHNPNI